MQSLHWIAWAFNMWRDMMSMFATIIRSGFGLGHSVFVSVSNLGPWPRLLCYRCRRYHVFVRCRCTARRYGLRSVDKVENVTGIVGYSVGFVVDSRGGLGLSAAPHYIAVSPTRQRLAIHIPATGFNDGDTLVVWFMVSDISGNRDQLRLTVGLDRTITGDDFQTKTVDDFTSRYSEMAFMNLIYFIFCKHLSVS